MPSPRLDTASVSPPESPNVLTPATDLSPRLMSVAVANGSAGLDTIAPLEPKLDSSPNTVDLVSPPPSPRISMAHRSPRIHDQGGTSTSLPAPPCVHRAGPSHEKTGLLSGVPSATPSPVETPYSVPPRFPLSKGSTTTRPYARALAAHFNDGFFESTPFWLGLYFFFNLGLTLFNKLVLVSFPFPYVGAWWPWTLGADTRL